MRSLLVVACLVAVTIAAVAQSSAPELDVLREPYRKNMLAVNANKLARSAPVTRSYVSALERLEVQVSKDSIAFASVRAEKERAAAGKPITEQAVSAMPAALADLRKRYENDLSRAVAAYTQQEQQLTRQYLTSLDQLQRRLTAQNQVAKAAAVRSEHDATVEAHAEIIGGKVDDASAAASSTVGAAAARMQGTLDAGLVKKIAAAVSAKSFSKTENSSEKNVAKQGWVDAPEEGAVLVGFEFFEVKRDGAPWIRSMRPYFLTAAGVVAGKDRGKMDKVTEKVLARPGYGVAGLLASDAKAGLQVIFMKIDPATGKFATDAASTYKSQWYGTKGKDKPKQVAGDGRLVIGVYGKTGSDADDLGFIVME